MTTTKNILIFLFIFYLIFNPKAVLAKPKSGTKKSAKTQEVNFEEMSIQGLIRQPTTEYVIQKPEGNYVRVLVIQQDFDKSIRETADWVR